jgi:SHS2 domain-containing protein
MAETKNNIEAMEQEAVLEANAANPQADAPKKNAVKSEPSALKNDAEDLGPAVVKPTDSNPDATKKTKEVSGDPQQKAQGSADAMPKLKEEESKEEEGEKKDVKEESEDSIDVSADVAALIKDEDLSETFKSKAATIFEAAVNTKVKEQKAKIQAAYEAKLQEDIESQKGELVEKVDSYLNYVVEEWMKDNSIAIERGIKGEIAEDFISGLKKLFEDHYIDVPDEKYNVLEDQASKIEELEKKLNEQVNKNVEQNKAIGHLKRQDIIDEASKDLADTAKEKFNKLAEEVEYSNENDFTTKVATIKEAYFGKKVETSGNEIDNVAEGSSQPEDLSNAMAAYTAAISKTKDIKLSK